MKNSISFYGRKNSVSERIKARRQMWHIKWFSNLYISATKFWVAYDDLMKPLKQAEQLEYCWYIVYSGLLRSLFKPIYHEKNNRVRAFIKLNSKFLLFLVKKAFKHLRCKYGTLSRVSFFLQLFISNKLLAAWLCFAHSDKALILEARPPQLLYRLSHLP